MTGFVPQAVNVRIISANAIDFGSRMPILLRTIYEFQYYVADYIVMTTRTLESLIPSIPVSDGAGVKLRRSIGQRPGAWLDTFLMLDEFFPDDPDNYLAGFPLYPHRGFETVTYMLDGHMLHEDHLGNRGDLLPGSVRWMTAGRGIIHSEMPQQTQGRMRDFQLWINLPAAEKMKSAPYRDLGPTDIPCVDLAEGGRAKVIAGALNINGTRHAGPIQQ